MLHLRKISLRGNKAWCHYLASDVLFSIMATCHLWFILESRTVEMRLCPFCPYSCRLANENVIFFEIKKTFELFEKFYKTSAFTFIMRAIILNAVEILIICISQKLDTVLSCYYPLRLWKLSNVAICSTLK